MGYCNFCKLQTYKKSAKRKKMRVVLVKSPTEDYPQREKVYMVRKDCDLSKLELSGSLVSTISDRCVC